MLTVELNSGRRVKVRFRHDIADDIDPRLPAYRRPRTACEIVELPSAPELDEAMRAAPKIVLGASSAICAVSDGFNKNVGRRIALTRALKGFSKSDRSRIWKAYHEKRGDLHALKNGGFPCSPSSL